MSEQPTNNNLELVINQEGQEQSETNNAVVEINIRTPQQEAIINVEEPEEGIPALEPIAEVADVVEEDSGISPQVEGPGPEDAPLDFELLEDEVELIFEQMHVMQKVRCLMVNKLFCGVGKRQLRYQKAISTGNDLTCLDDSHEIRSNDIIMDVNLNDVNRHFWQGLITLCSQLKVIHIEFPLQQMSKVFDAICENYGSTLECFTYKEMSVSHHRFRSPECKFKPESGQKLSAIQHINCDSLSAEFVEAVVSASKDLKGLVVGWIQGNQVSAFTNLPKGFKILRESQWANVFFLSNRGFHAICQSPAAETIEEICAYLEGQDVPDLPEFRFPCLKTLKLGGRLASGGPEFVSCLSNSPNVEVLDFHRLRGIETVLSETYQSIFRNCRNLKILKIQGEFLTDAFFIPLCKGCPDMVRLSIVARSNDETHLSDESLKALTRLEKLEHLHLQEVGKFTGTSVHQFLQAAPKLQYLHLSSSEVMITGDVINMIRQREQESLAAQRRYTIHLREVIDNRNYRIFKLGSYGFIALG